MKEMTLVHLSYITQNQPISIPDATAIVSIETD